jgi:hypothetical protein
VQAGCATARPRSYLLAAPTQQQRAAAGSTENVDGEAEATAAVQTAMQPESIWAIDVKARAAGECEAVE